MYCGESRGTDIDHFEPISETPSKTFEWPNHLLACKSCNSNYKRDQFPRGADGTPLLIDPTREDPHEHLRLELKTGRYRALTTRGTETIRVFGLNEDDLVRSRVIAFDTRGATLCWAKELLTRGRPDEAERCLRALPGEPNAGVLHQMIRASQSPYAAMILGADVVAALQDPAVRAVLRDVIPGAEPPRVTDATGRSG